MTAGGPSSPVRQADGDVVADGRQIGSAGRFVTQPAGKHASPFAGFSGYAVRIAMHRDDAAGKKRQIH